MLTCNKCYNVHRDQCMGKAGMFDCCCKCFKKWNINATNAIFIGKELHTRLTRYVNMKKLIWKRMYLKHSG